MNAYMAHYIIAQKLLTEGFIQQTDIENKHILLISDNGVGRQMGVNECEYIEQYLQEHGAKECIVLDMIDLERISMEKFDPNEHFYGNHAEIAIAS